MQVFRPSPTTIHWGYFDSRLDPIGEVESGETFHVRCVTGSPDDPVPGNWIPPELADIYATVSDRGPGTHMITGPLWVDGATAGSVLQVDVEHAELGAPYGYNILHPLLGMFPGAVADLERHIVPYDFDAGLAHVLPGVAVPVSPFFGILATGPPRPWGRISSFPPRAHGGNLDLPELVAGTTVLLPVHEDGALFSAGDGHACQGDGEVDCTAVETCLEGDIRLTVRDDVDLPKRLPLAVTPTAVITLGFHPSFDRAAEIAVECMLDLLVAECGLARNAAYRLVSMTAHVRVTQLVNEHKGAHVVLDRTIVRQLGGDPFFERVRSS